MAYTIELLGASSPYPYEIGSVTPFISPSWVPEYDSSVPRNLVAFVKTWTISGVLVADTEENTAAAYTAFAAAVEPTRANPITGVVLKRDGNIVDVLATSVGGGTYESVVLNVASMDGSDSRTWRSRLPFTLTVSARKLQADNGIAKEERRDDYSYDEAGLVTITRTGTLETSGTGAEAKARTRALTNPDSNTYRFVTAGPENINVSKLDIDDRKAAYLCVLQQRGDTIPANVGPSFSKTTSTVTRRRDQVVTTTATARGPDATAAVQGAEPSVGVVSDTLIVDPYSRFAQARYIQSLPLGDRMVTRAFVVTGGASPITWSPRDRGRPPAKHVMGRLPYVVQEVATVEATGAAPEGLLDFPAPIPTLEEDESARVVTPPVRVAEGQSQDSDRWQASIRRTYVMAEAVDGWYQLSLALAEAGRQPVKDALTPSDTGRGGDEGGSDGDSLRSVPRTLSAGTSLIGLTNQIRFTPAVRNTAPPPATTTPPPAGAGFQRTAQSFLSVRDPRSVLQQLLATRSARAGSQPDAPAGSIQAGAVLSVAATPPNTSSDSKAVSPSVKPGINPTSEFGSNQGVL